LGAEVPANGQKSAYFVGIVGFEQAKRLCIVNGAARKGAFEGGSDFSAQSAEAGRR
jgi:hypothetical protein